MKRVKWVWTRILILGLMFLMMIMSNGATAEAASGKWEHNAKGWWYTYLDGTYAIGWKKIDGKWYYFNADGYMVKGWKLIDEKLYYFNSNGCMVTGTKVIGGVEYSFGSGGALIEHGSFSEFTYDKNYNSTDRRIPSKGTSKVALFLVDFPDCKHTEWSSRVIKDTTKGYLHNYYKEESYNKLDLDVSIVGDWYTTVNERDYYSFLSNEKGYEYARAVLLDEVIKKFDNTVDFSEFDANRDGYIDEIVFLCAGESGGFAGFWWPCSTDCSYIIEADGVRAGKYAWIPGQIDDPSVTIHEVGHALGLPDLYDRDAQGAETFTVDDMMKNNKGHLNAFSKIKLGWIDPIRIKDNAEISLLPSEKKSSAAIVYPKGDEKSEQFFVLEYISLVEHGNVNRLPNGGLRIWRVNVNSPNNRHGNTPHIENVDWQNNVTGGIYYDQGQDFHGVIWTEDMSFTPYAYPSSYFYKGNLVSDGFEFSGISITDIHADGKKLNCKITYEDEPTENQLTYTSDYSIGNQIKGTIIFPVEVYLNGTDISLKGEDGTDIPFSYWIDYKIENHANTRFVFEADISNTSGYSYRLTIKPGNLISAFGVPNDEINIDMTNIVGGDYQLADRGFDFSGISEIVKVKDGLYTFQIIDGQVTMLHIDKYYNILDSKPLFKTTTESTALTAEVYDAERMLLLVTGNADSECAYSVKPDGTYEVITPLASSSIMQPCCLNNNFFVFRIDESGCLIGCLINLDNKKVTTIKTDLTIFMKVRNSNKYIYGWKNEGGENYLYLYDCNVKKLAQKNFTDIGVFENTEVLECMFDYDGKPAIISLVKDSDNLTRFYVTIFNDNLDVIKRKCIYADVDSTGPGMMYQTDKGFVLGLETTKSIIASDNRAYYTSFAKAVFYDENLNFMFERVLDKDDNGNYIAGVIELDDDEYMIFSPFESMHFSIDSKNIKVCNHNYSIKTITRKVSYTMCGIITITCSHCGDSYIEVIPKPKYSEEWVNGKWYNKDGTQTSTDKIKWYRNLKGWWIMDTKGWYPKDQWQKIDGVWYYFKYDGYMASNEWCNGYWLNKNGTWTYKARASWKKDSNGWSYGDTKGWYAKNQLLNIDGVTYYFKNDGHMASREWVKGYYFNKDGSWTYTYKGTWRKTNNKWWFGDTSGWYAKNCTCIIDGKVYTFDKNGYLIE